MTQLPTTQHAPGLSRSGPCCLPGSELGHVVSLATPHTEGSDKKSFGFSEYISKYLNLLLSSQDCLKGHLKIKKKTSGLRVRTPSLMGRHLRCAQLQVLNLTFFLSFPCLFYFYPILMTTADHRNMWWSGGVCQAVTTIHRLIAGLK